MKIAIYIEDGVTQLILTPDTDWEKAVLAKIEVGNFKIYRGEFYYCNGGWHRQGSGKDSLMLLMEKETNPS